MLKAVYPGSFDPVTNGHVDIAERAARLFDHVVVAVFHNDGKDPLFSVEERVSMLADAMRHLDNVSVDSFDGLQVEYARRVGARVIVRGLRALSDFDFEIQMAQMNRKLDHAIDTVFVTTSSQYSYLSSRIVKEVASFGGCVRGLVPRDVEERLARRFARGRGGPGEGGW